jgi:tRNA(fMet)-specific endonuclease VapC
MKYLLDTNTCIRYLNRRSTFIIRKLGSLSPDDIAVCSIVKAEMFAGAGKSNTPQQTRAKQEFFLNRFVSLTFDDKAADVYGTIRAQLEKAGTPIGPLDTLIAAIALTNSLILVTHNTGEFGRVAGLKFEDWEI